jgi:hypothetical protein
MKMEKDVRESIKKSLLFYGGSYDFVKNDIERFTDSAQNKLVNGSAKSADHAAFLAIDECF